MAPDNWQERTELMLSPGQMEALSGSRVLVAGLGGVGGFAAEMLCRAGIGRLTIIDSDRFYPSNRNRQLGALRSTEGEKKTDVWQKRLLDINPQAEVTVIDEFIKDERIEQILQEPYDYVLDAIDSLAPKIFLIYHTLQKGIPLISSMGAGGKTDPSLIRVADFSETYNDKLARMLRKRLHKMDVYTGFKVVFSPEKIRPETVRFVEGESNKKTTVGTLSYMPPMFGGFMAAEVIRNLARIEPLTN